MELTSLCLRNPGSTTDYTVNYKTEGLYIIFNIYLGSFSVYALVLPLGRTVDDSVYIRMPPNDDRRIGCFLVLH